MVGVEPEIIKRAPANRVGVLVLRKCFTGPCQRIGCLIRRPWRAAIPLIVECAVICPARFLRRRMKSDVANIDSGSQRHAKGLNPSVKVLVVQRIFIVPDAGSWIAYLVTHKPDAIVPRIGLELVHGGACACPCLYGRLQPNGVPNR